MDEERMFTYKIVECKTIYVQIDNRYSISVGFELYKHGLDENGEANTTLEGVFRLGFELGSNEQEILAEINKFCETRQRDLETTEKDAELNEQLEEAELLREKLLNSNENV
jgi:hypothetical protein